ncbi:uncharacterized protein LOC128553755, partial [Mercenaria mercenaria]|uniref:uncharacterized protein LOC128553755 n=1 Tax=Mercenaria mercenaria TaxID=6596 RepID=UPI00234ECE49
RSKETVRDVLDEKYFVRTEQFEKARTKLLENNIIVLNGAPGEGKTTVAKKLLVEVSKNERYIQLNTYSDWRFVILDNVEAVLIDDMFGSGIFDKEECRKWQKHIPSIASAVESKHLYVIITSRSYILTEAVEKMIVESFFTKENVVTLSSEDLTPKERKTILEKHFTKACYKNEEISELTEKSEHSILLQNIVELKLKSPDVSSTIGFPECARLFANNTDLYSEGVKFFKGPMACVKSNISGLLNDDDTFVAFFVLWAQTSRTLSSIDLELSIQETSDKVTKPICKLQFRPKDHIRKIRHSLHKHRGGFIHFDSTNEVFSFSHRVVQDSVGIVSFEKNTTAAIEFCDTTFIENFIRIGHHECDSGMHDIFMRKDKSSEGLDEQESSQGLTYYRETAQQKNVSSTENKSALLPWCVIHLSQARYAQLSLQIGKLVIYPAFRTNELSMSPSKKLQKVSQYLDPTLFKHEVFKDKNFCDSFFRELNERNMLETILMVPVRTLDREFSEFKFLKMPSTEIRLPSYLIWAKEARSPLSDMCFHIIDSVSDFASKQELSMAMLISTKLGDCTLVKYFLEQGAEIDINMMSLALAANKEKMFEMLLGRHAVLNDEATFLHEICKVGYSEIVSKLIIKGVDIMQRDSSGLYPIHHAIQKGHLETVKVLLDNDESQAEVEFKPDTGKMSLFHFATEYQRMTIIDELLKRGKRPTKLDGKGRTPFLYSVYKRSTNVVHRMLQTAIEDGMQSHPDKDNCTPLYTALKNIVGHSARREECKIFEGIALELCKFTNNLHLVNSSGETPLKYACKNGLKAVAKEILKHGDPYENEGSTIFHHFVTADDRESIDTFLQLNIDPNIHDKYHRTPLMLANVLGKKMVIRVLKKDRRILDYHKEIGMVEDRLELPDRNVNTRSLSSVFERYTDPESYRRGRRRRREDTAYGYDYDDDLLVYD